MPEVVDAPVADLREADENPRTIEQDRFDALKHSMRVDPEMLRARPVIVDAETREVVAGNMRLRAAKELGWTEIPAYFHKFESEGQKREWMLRDNQEYGEWVPDDLAAIIYKHQQEGFDTSLLGFTDDDVMKAVRRVTGEALVPEPSEPPQPTLAAEAMVEIRLTRERLEEIQPTLEDWMERDGMEIAVTT